MQFFDILSYKVKEKEKFSSLKSLIKSLEDKKFQIKNQNKALVNYTKQFTKKKGKASIT